MKTINKRDYHAKLIIHDMPKMKSVTYRRLVDWLEAKVKELKKANTEDYSNVYTSRFMK
jgi:effector-binding domain-containing protein